MSIAGLGVEGAPSAAVTLPQQAGHLRSQILHLSPSGYKSVMRQQMLRPHCTERGTCVRRSPVDARRAAARGRAARVSTHGRSGGEGRGKGAHTHAGVRLFAARAAAVFAGRRGVRVAQAHLAVLLGAAAAGDDRAHPSMARRAARRHLIDVQALALHGAEVRARVAAHAFPHPDGDGDAGVEPPPPTK